MKASHYLTVAVVFSLLSCESCVGQPQSSSSIRFQNVRRFWEWSQYWGVNGLEFLGADYPKSNLKVRAVTFASKPAFPSVYPYWGFCSEQLRVCQAYNAWEDGVVYLGAGIKLAQGESGMDGYTRFLNRRFHGDDSGPLENLWPEPGDPSIEIAVTVETLGFQPLREPGSVRLKTRNLRAEQAYFLGLKQAGVSPETTCVTTIPFSDEYAPSIPILTECPDFTSIQVFRRSAMEWVFTVGGSLTHPEGISRLRNRILSNAALKLGPR